MEANIKTIIVNNGIGREVTDKGIKWGTFSGPFLEDYKDAGYPCPELANTKPGETVEAELMWQYKPFGDVYWSDINSEPNDKFKINYDTRQIWRLVPKEEKAAELFANFNEGKAKLKSEPAFLSWLHELTTVGYARNIFISTDHEDAIVTIYALKGDDSIDKCLDMYLNFKRRWKALNEL